MCSIPRAGQIVHSFCGWSQREQDAHVCPVRCECPVQGLHHAGIQLAASVDGNKNLSIRTPLPEL